MTKDFVLSDDSDEEDKPTNDEPCTNGEQNVSLECVLVQLMSNSVPMVNRIQNVSLECVLVQLMSNSVPMVNRM
jgi:hypothetical protein